MSTYLDRKRGTAWRHTAIALYQDQHAHLAQKAKEQGRSISQLIRDLIDEDMKRSEPAHS